jgi:ABC-type cobalamin/Fe3+-siderophores transport system ATPase subunit
MSFQITIPSPSGKTTELDLDVGQTLFVLGANGAGKSTLMHTLYGAHHDRALRISAHRQTWFQSGATSLSADQKRSTEANMRGSDTNRESRWLDHYSVARPNLAIYDLVDAQNIRARSIAEAVDAEDFDHAKTLSKSDAPIKVLNDLLLQSNIPIAISVQKGEQVVARKCGGEPYSIAELSDGERNTLLLAANVLTVKPGTLVIVDEPERHLHRSIISPLLTLLFAARQDCAFIVSTHEVMLPIDNPSTRALLIRSCTFVGTVPAWETDLVQSMTGLGDELLKEILGSRRRILFVEGTERSLDKPLYSILFPNVSVIAKSSCRDVEHTVSSIRDAEQLHWLRAFGVVDHDRRGIEAIERLKAKGVYALQVFSVESVYYHPEIQQRVALRQAAVNGGDPQARLREAKRAALLAISQHVQRLSERAAEKQLRASVLKHLPRREDIAAGKTIVVSINVAAEVESERSRLQAALATDDLVTVICRYPVRETSALAELANRLGFQNRLQYENAVRQLLMDDPDALAFVRSLFGTLGADIDAL